MPIKLTAESFLSGVRQSGLVDEPELDNVLRQLKSAQINLDDSQDIAEALVERDVISRWQSDKLLQGKHKGFILGRYRLVDLLGRGEMSSVYLAEHVMMKRRCAVKVLPAHRVKDTSYLGRFHREAEAVASLDHPNIVRAYDVGLEKAAGADIHFLVMEYVAGQSLDKRLEKCREFKLTEAAEFIRQAAEGLAHAHANGLVHRDIKPGNLLIDGGGTVKLLDLGLARFFKSTDEESLTIKHDEKVLGTADYLAPEQAVDSHAVDERADIYSLGCTFYFALTGQPPFTDGTLVQRLLAHQTQAPPAIQRLRADVPTSLADIIEKMMQKQPGDRYQTAADVAQALGQWLIDHADSGWKRSHPEIVARLSGIEAVVGSTGSTPGSPDEASEIDGDPSDFVFAEEAPSDAPRSSKRALQHRGPDRSESQAAGTEPNTRKAAPRQPVRQLHASGRSRPRRRHVVRPAEAKGTEPLAGWSVAGVSVYAGTGVVAALLLVAAVIAASWGIELIAETGNRRPVTEVIISGPSDFNEPGPGESLEPTPRSGE